MYRDNLSETNRTINQIRAELKQRGGSGQARRDAEREMKEVEKQLSTIQQEVCKVVQKMKTNFGIDPEAKLSSTDQHVSQDSCSIAD